MNLNNLDLIDSNSLGTPQIIVQRGKDKAPIVPPNYADSLSVNDELILRNPLSGNSCESILQRVIDLI
jgi:hypothetical protein